MSHDSAPDENGVEEKWREDFPIEWVADSYVTRRDFTRFLVLTSGATFLGNGYFVGRARLQPGAEDAPRVRIAGRDEVPVGGVRLFRYPTEEDPAMLIRLDTDTYVAFRQRCTHLSCPVHFNAREERLDCPCHNGAFDARTGQVLYGPPPRPLPRIALHIDDDTIWASGLHPQDAGRAG